jgi:hypothetical protein
MTNTIDINDIEETISVRPHHYPIENSDIDNTCYDNRIQRLDYGYQLAKAITSKQFCHLEKIRILNIDHNKLTSLPTFLPELRVLDCSNNNITFIPKYPKLVEINFSNNNISHFSSTTVRQVSCSHNPIQLGDLPECVHLYADHTQISSFNLSQYPKIKYLDLGSNNICQLSGTNDNLVELHIPHNKLETIPYFPNLTHLIIHNNLLRSIPNMMLSRYLDISCNKLNILPSLPSIVDLIANNNRITEIITYLHLQVIDISYNSVTTIDKQPVLELLIASYNKLSSIGDCPKLNQIELAYNQISTYIVPKSANNVLLHNNPLRSLTVTSFDNLSGIKIDYPAYVNFYKKYYAYISQVSTDIDKTMLIKNSKLKLGNDEWNEIFVKINGANMSNINHRIKKAALLVYSHNCNMQTVKSVRDIIETSEYRQIVEMLRNSYYNTVIFDVKFSGRMKLGSCHK